MSASFPAAYAGRCGNCAEHFRPGEEVQYDSDGLLIVVDCCGTLDDPPGIGRPRAEPSLKTVPRGKTAADRCGTCFQIPASNGVCGCS